MSLGAGTRLGVYEITSLIGQGGMGDVYRARDIRLGRDVALKALPDAFVSDPERRARFEREAQLLATLNHPNIAQVYGFEEGPPSSSGSPALALVMELVDGEDLSRRLERGPIAPGETIAVARQLMDALEAAHERGIVHRDLKPGNIMVTPSGGVKVLDFGLAKAIDGTGAAGGPAAGALTNSPTIITPAITVGGVILGTAAYMSPEQAKGCPADKRSDIWAFGCVVYETLSGRRAFGRADVSDTLVAVLRDEPDWAALPHDTPANLRDVLKRCLEKDRKRRLPDITVARYLLDDSSNAGSRIDTSGPARRTAVAIAGGIALIAASAVGTHYVTQPTVQPRPQPMRFTVVPPGNARLSIGNDFRDLAISPDGKWLAFITGTSVNSMLFVRAIDRLEPTGFAGLQPAAPFFSPDGAWIGFGRSMAPNRLMKVAVGGGPPLMLSEDNSARGGTWGSDGTIILASPDPATGLLAVPESGGDPKVLTRPDTQNGEVDHVLPSLLPNGKAVLFTIMAAEINNHQVAVLDLVTGRVKTLVRGGTSAQFVLSGHLIYAAAGSLQAVRFDPDLLEVLSNPVPVVDQVVTKASGAADFAVSRNGTLVYVPGVATDADGPQRSLVWVGRDGREESINAPPRVYQFPRLSPDGKKIALDLRDHQSDIWIWELATQGLTRLTDDPAFDGNPAWSPDGRRIAFASNRAKGVGVYWQSADGTGTAQPLALGPSGQNPRVFTQDGMQLVLGGPEGLFLLRADGKSQPERLLPKRLGTFNAELSPDGKWLLYQSAESGTLEIHVRPFPNVTGGHWQISSTGGTKPVWARDGRELFYLDADDKLTSVAVQSSATFSFGNPAKVLDTVYYSSPNGRTYDVSADGKKFLMIKDTSPGTTDASGATITVVLNWFEELKAKLP